MAHALQHFYKQIMGIVEYIFKIHLPFLEEPFYLHNEKLDASKQIPFSSFFSKQLTYILLELVTFIMTLPFFHVM